MQKQMRTCIKLQQFRLGQKSDKVNVFVNPKSGGEHFQFRLQRPFACDEKFRFGMIPLENRERAQTRRHTFFRDQSARLDHSPLAVWRRLSIYEWKLI